MNSVFVIDTEKRPQPPVHPAVARRLLAGGEAAVWRRYPFTLILTTGQPPCGYRAAQIRLARENRPRQPYHRPGGG